MSTESFVEQLFSRFLGRSADLAGRDYWVNLIDGGSVTASDVTQAFLTSPEFNGVVAPIARLYYAAFGRIPDAGGLNYWVTQVRSGATMSQVSADFMRSAEFAKLYGTTLTDTRFVDLLYQNVLGRTADAAGKAYWLARLTTDKIPRPTVLQSFANSPELIQSKSAEILVVEQYQTLLGLTPTKAEVTAALKLDPVQLTTQLYASSSYSGVPVPHLNTGGMAVDGYLSGALVFVDQNGNRQLDPGEISTTTNIQGNFSFSGRENFNGVLLTMGGRDLSTGQFHEGQFSAPAGSTVITPLTTVLQAMLEQSTFSRGATTAILREQLALDADFDLTRFDPIGQAVKDGASAEAQALALNTQVVTAQISIIVTEAVAFLHGALLGTDSGVADRAVFEALATILLDQDRLAPFDLTSAANIQLIISNAAHLLQATPEQQNGVDALVGTAGLAIGILNAALAAVNESTPLASLTKIAQIQYVAQEVSVLLQNGVVGNDLSTVLAQLEPDMLAVAIDAAAGRLGPVVQDIVAPTLIFSSPANKAAPVLASSNIVLTFSEDVVAGMGNITLANGFETRNIAIGDASQVAISGNTVTINPGTDLNNGTTYNVMIDKGALFDKFDNPYAGIKDATSLTFTIPNKQIGLAAVNGTTGSRFDATTASGMAVASAGDVNGDGFADFLVGASSTSNTGASYLLFGKGSAFTATTKLASLPTASGVRFDGVASGDFSGGAVAGAGDVNRDGFDDILIGANAASPNAKSMAGSVYVVNGKASGFTAANKLSTLDGKTGFRIDGDTANGLLGTSVASAGDINGDGLPDILIGANGLNENTGAAYVVLGTTGTRTATLNVSTLNGSNGFRISGVANNDNTGFAVSSAGDVNNDGFDDMLVGAFSANRGAGATYLVFGKASGFSANLDLSTLDGSNGVRLDGLEGENTGRSLAKLGDINGDGISDFIIGAPRGNGDTGGAYVVLGKVDPYEASFDLSQLDGSTGFRINGVAAQDLTGFSVSSAGDINGDGLADILIGARDTHGRAGSGYVVYGSSEPFPAQFNLADLNGVNGYRLFGNTVDLAGGSVAGVGDVNGDGLGDLVVGAQGLTSVAGTSYLVFGTNASNIIETFGTSAADKINGTDQANRISGATGDDTITGFGGADLIHGGAGKDRIVVSDLNFQLVDGGGGADILALSGQELSLDLSLFRGKITSIETIELTGSGNNEITIAAADVLAVSDLKNTLTITGNASDLVHLSGAWVAGKAASGLLPYTLGNITVLVGTALTVDVM